MNLEATRSPPIFKLNPDVLSIIFEMNADIFKRTEDPLRNARNVSQVCRSWRELALASPRLWARVMDFSHFCHGQASSWGREVLHRSANAPLWIKRTLGQSFAPPEQSNQFFFGVLNDHWERIERLQLLILRYDPNGHLWNPLYRRAPRLTELNLEIYCPKIIDSLQNRLLLDGDAPALRKLSIRARGYKFNQSPWLSNLRSLDIMWNSPFHFHDFLDALRIMPLLESLTVRQLKNRHMADATQILPTASLPKLGYLQILHSHCRVSAQLIKQLVVAPTCSLVLFFGGRSVSDMFEDNLTLSLQPWSEFVGRYLESCGTTNMTVACNPSCMNLIIGDHDISNSSNVPRHNSGIFMSLLAHEETTFPDHVYNIFLTAFSFPCLTNVTVLGARLDSPTSQLANAFMSFLSVFPSIEVLNTDEQTIRHLFENRDDIPNLIFPKLDTVNLGVFDDYVDSGLPFGGLIKSLDLRQSRIDAGMPLKSLKEVCGLKILCQGGDPDDPS